MDKDTGCKSNTRVALPRVNNKVEIKEKYCERATKVLSTVSE